MILNQPERSKRDRAERDDDLWVENIYLAAQKARTIPNLSDCRLAVCSRIFARIAQHGVGDEDVIARKVD